MLKSSAKEIGFPNLRLFQLIAPDNIKTCEELVIDVLLNFFSKETLLIVEEKRLTIDKYYKNRQNEIASFLNKTKPVIENTMVSLGHGKLKEKKSILDDFTNWYDKLNRLLGVEEVNELLFEVLEEKLALKRVNVPKKETNEINIQEPKTEQVTDSETLTLLFLYSNNLKSADEIDSFLEQRAVSVSIKEVYINLLNTIKDNHFSKKEIYQLQKEYLMNQKKSMLDNFSEKWCVSVEELSISAMEYQKGMEKVPNISGIINSRDFEAYKVKKPEAKPFKYSQQMKLAWHKLLDNCVIPLEEEL